MRPGAHRYYVEAANELVPGVGERALVAGESPGAWVGSGTSSLGVGGAVEPVTFGEVFDGHDPGTGRTLRAPRGDHTVAGYDLTFAAPKSVSLLHLLAPREIAEEVGAGHGAAVAEAAGYVERTALRVRRTQGDRVNLPTTGLVAAEFVHRTSRALDPHLHSHLVVANVAQGVDGRWSAVDGRELFAHVRATRGIYHARLRMELSERLGAGWVVRSSGMGDVLGVDPGLRRLFSQRLAGMEEHLARRGAPADRRGMQSAFYATRPDKDRTVTVEGLMREWRGRASDFGFDLGDLSGVVGRGRSGRGPEVIESNTVRRSLEQLPEYRRTLAHRDLVAMIAAATPHGAATRMIESAATRIVESAGPPLTRRDAGDSTARTGRVDRRRGPFEARWTTSDVQRAFEQGKVELLDQTMGRGASDVDRSSGRGRDRVGRDPRRAPRGIDRVRSGPELGR
jgi:conjugative relaxase-like TrwC/TraI family protein